MRRATPAIRRLGPRATCRVTDGAARRSRLDCCDTARVMRMTTSSRARSGPVRPLSALRPRRPTCRTRRSRRCHAPGPRPSTHRAAWTRTSRDSRAAWPRARQAAESNRSASRPRESVTARRPTPDSSCAGRQFLQPGVASRIPRRGIGSRVCGGRSGGSGVLYRVAELRRCLASATCVFHHAAEATKLAAALPRCGLSRSEFVGLAAPRCDHATAEQWQVERRWRR